MRWTYAFGSLAAAGVLLAGGSDCPVETPEPLRGMAAARHRAGIIPEEALSPDAALALFTEGASLASRLPPPLQPGSPADMVVLDSDRSRQSHSWWSGSSEGNLYGRSQVWRHPAHRVTERSGPPSPRNSDHVTG